MGVERIEGKGDGKNREAAYWCGMKPECLTRRLYRQRRLTATELASRLRALDALASGKLRPPVAAVAKPAANQEISHK